MTAGEDPRPPYAAAGTVGGLILAIYVATIAPTTQFWDTSEYIAAAKVLGIPHPPGNPLFVLLANVWGKLPIVSHYALRINLFSAVCSAAASALLFLVAERWLRAWQLTKGERWAIAGGGILVGATSFTVWHQSVVNAKVYTLALLSIALVLWLTVRWGDLEPGSKRKRLLLTIAYMTVLSAGNHLMGLLIVPATLAYIAFTAPRRFIDWKFILAKLPVIAVALTVFLFLIVRARHYPPINEGEPTTWESFWAVLSRTQYQKPPVTDRQANLYWQVVNYFQYFAWQFARDWSVQIQGALAAIFGALGLTGIWALFAKTRREGTALLLTMGTLTLALVVYLNFRYGFSIRPGESLDREVRERDYFFVASFQLWGLCTAIGIGAVVGRVRLLLKRVESPPARALPVTLALLICLVPLLGNRHSAPRSGETIARQFAVDLLNSVEPYAILVTAGDNDLFPLWYAQEVEGVRPDVLVVNQSLLNTPWHLRQVRRRDLPEYDPSQSPVAWPIGPKPSDPPFSLTERELDSLPPAVRVDRNSYLPIDNIEFRIPAGLVPRTDLAMMQLLQDNLGRRPIYFARTTGGYGDVHGLTPFLLGRGLARRLVTDSIQPTDSVRFSQTFGWIDMARSKELMFGVYGSEAAARHRPRGWPDPPSSPVLSLYGILYSDMADLLERGDAADRQLAAEARDIADRVLANLR